MGLSTPTLEVRTRAPFLGSEEPSMKLITFVQKFSTQILAQFLIVGIQNRPSYFPTI